MWRIVFAVLIACAISSAAHAQSAPPFGYWTSADNGESLLVSESGYCEFKAGATQVVGACSWNGGNGGGILTIMNTNQFQPAAIPENIVWVNQTTITVWGDVFYRRQ